MEENQSTSLFGLSIDPATKTHLSEAARWARFLSVVGFIFITLFVIMAIFGGAYFSTMFSRYDSSGYGSAYSNGLAIGMVVYYLVVALIGFFAYLFLYRFAAKMRAALTSNDQTTLNESFQNLKIFFRYIGIITIIALAFIAVAILLVIVGAGVSTFR